MWRCIFCLIGILLFDLSLVYIQSVYPLCMWISRVDYSFSGSPVGMKIRRKDGKCALQSLDDSLSTKRCIRVLSELFYGCFGLIIRIRRKMVKHICCKVYPTKKSYLFNIVEVWSLRPNSMYLILAFSEIIVVGQFFPIETSHWLSLAFHWYWLGFIGNSLANHWDSLAFHWAI